MLQISNKDNKPIEDYLGIKSIPRFAEVINDHEKLKPVCCALYDCEEDKISKIQLNHMENWYNVKSISFDLYGSNYSFFLKTSLDYGMTEALGMALANILLDKNYSFIISDKDYKTLAIDGIKGRPFFDWDKKEYLDEDEFNEDSSRSYGIALELANTLALSDRNGTNVLLTKEDKVVHVDFGHLFALKNPLTKLSLITPKNSKAIKEGIELGRQIIKKNFKKKKQLLEDIVKEAKIREALQAFRHIKHEADPVKAISNYIKHKKYDF